MIQILHHLVLIVLCIVTIPITAQPDCRFNGVENLKLSQDSVLSWIPYPWGTCTIDHYLVYIKVEYEDEKVYITDEPRLDVSFLPMCVHTIFRVAPISPSDIQGGIIWLEDDMPVPPNVNLTIAAMYLNLAFGGITLSWYVDEEFRICAKRFRVLIYNEDNDTPEDVYVTGNSLVLYDYDAIPCSTYQFGVRALYNLEEEGPVSHLIRYTAKPQRLLYPTLKSLRLGMTTAELVWQMESFSENRCPVTSVTVDASPHFITAYPVRDQNSRTNFPITLSGLAPDAMYILNVTVTNTGGRTDPFFVAVQTSQLIVP